MDGPRDLRRMPRGERCPECGSQRWYLQDGLRFCSRGHQIEGFVQFDLGDEEDSGKMGAVARREKTPKTQKSRASALTGQAGRDLYLEALQLIIRSQILWLVYEKGHREELEIVVRDLWDLRIRGHPSSLNDEANGTADLEFFSSATIPTERQTTSQPQARRQNWDPDLGQKWPLPRVPDTLALCYLGCVLLRIPTRISEILRWVNDGSMPYKRAYRGLPQEIRDRMPSSYIKVLKLPLRTILETEGLIRTTMDLVLSFQLNYDMVFPKINHIPMLITLAKELALPIESIIVVRKLAAVLGIQFQFPIDKSANSRLDFPEVQLTALLIVATKICFPLANLRSHFEPDGPVRLPILNWKHWHSRRTELLGLEKPSETHLNFDNVTPGQVASMTDEQLDAYFSHVSSLIDKTSDNPIAEFFPFEEPTAVASSDHDVSIEDLQKTAQVLFSHSLESTQTTPLSRSETTATGSLKFEAFRNTQDLSENAMELFKAVGGIIGISLQTTIDAVYRVERKIVEWQMSNQRHA